MQTKEKKNIYRKNIKRKSRGAVESRGAVLR